MSTVNSGDGSIVASGSRMVSISESGDEFQANPGQQQRPVKTPERYSITATEGINTGSWRTAKTNVRKKYDLNNDGKFDGQEVENIIDEYINTLNKHANLSESHKVQKKVISFGAVMIILLSLSNLGTAFLAVSLAKETRIVDGKMVNNDGTQSAVLTETAVKTFSGSGLPLVGAGRRLNADGSRTFACFNEETVEDIFDTVAVSGVANTVVRDENNRIEEIIPVQGQASRAQDGMTIDFPNAGVRFVRDHPNCRSLETNRDLGFGGKSPGPADGGRLLPFTIMFAGNNMRKQSKNDYNVADVQMSDCREYCSLLSQAQNRCPYASDGHGGQNEDCLTSCLGAAFSHDGTDQDFELSDTIQCRMNHAKMAIKEGALTNSQHCLHATIPGPHRCVEDAEAIRNSIMLEIGKTYLYYISASLQAVGNDSSKVSQIYLLSLSYLVELRQRLYVAYPSTGISSTSYKEIDCTSISSRKYRSADGTCNSLEVPSMGAAQTQFIHSLKPSLPHSNGNADITAIAKIMKRPRVDQDPDTFENFNQLASAWIQFNLHDWFQHNSNEDSNDGVLHNRVTHWWDASQLYGSSIEEEQAIRLDDGKIYLDNNDELDYNSDGSPITGFGDNFWAGLHIFHTIFAREHNFIVDELRSAYPSMSNDEKYGAARLCVVAIIAKIHTLEWTPALLDNPASTFSLNINWFGLKPAASKFFSEDDLKPIKDMINNVRVPSVENGEYDTNLTMYNTPFSMTEEFAAVYRMHPLLPDNIEVGNKTFTLNELSFKDARKIVGVNTTEVFLQAFAKTKARTLSLRNYPYELYELNIPGRNETINLAEIELARDRERNLPRYNDARRQLFLHPYKSLQDLTDNEEELALLESVYDDVDQVDFMVGCLVDKERPEGFAFGIVPYHIFVVMSSARIFSDRFFQEGFTAEYYTEWGLDYVGKQSFQSILIRQFPELSQAVPSNPFLNNWGW